MPPAVAACNCIPPAPDHRWRRALCSYREAKREAATGDAEEKDEAKAKLRFESVNVRVCDFDDAEYTIYNDKAAPTALRVRLDMPGWREIQACPIAGSRACAVRRAERQRWRRPTARRCWRRCTGRCSRRLRRRSRSRSTSRPTRPRRTVCNWACAMQRALRWRCCSQTRSWPRLRCSRPTRSAASLRSTSRPRPRTIKACSRSRSRCARTQRTCALRLCVLAARRLNRAQGVLRARRWSYHRRLCAHLR